MKISLCYTTVIAALLLMTACNTRTDSRHDNPLLQSDNTPKDTAAYNDIRYRDQQQIEKVIYSFCEHFDNGTLGKCLDFMADSIRGEIDGVKITGRQRWAEKIEALVKSTEDSHFQPRHILSNMQFAPAANDTVQISMYASVLWTDLLSGQIQLMSVGYYKGKMVKQDGKWLIATLHSLPDSRLVKGFYQDKEI
ncbi:nuclear transport factor 2 family protein [Chitinophaga solisilvae]|uniref:nuclear transport factor 2 family protein n=1 Tax=Chitinophaga solisilvae TaxID=1233460 RepID=UPI00136DC03E|nr:nuclear transport factor 2 family protein [Chitinophaga solisilvae]